MKLKYRLLKIIICLGLLIFLMNFSLNRFQNARFQKFKIHIVDEDRLGFINPQTIQSQFYQQFKDTQNILVKDISIYHLEQKLKQNPYTDSLNIFLDQDKKLNVFVIQKVPIARIHTSQRYFYLTDKGEEMPISDLYSEPCLMVEGPILPEDYPNIVELQQVITEDNLLKKHIVGVRKLKDNSFILLVNVEDFFVEMGSLDHSKEKLTHLKAFYQQYLNHVGLHKYNKISLKYNNQIVATKK